MRGMAGWAWRRIDGGRPPVWQAGFAVRRDWGTRGEHDVFDWRSTSEQAERRLEMDRAFWRGSPARPTGWSVVEISRRDVALHARYRRGCKSPGCPAAISTATAMSGVAL